MHLAAAGAGFSLPKDLSDRLRLGALTRLAAFEACVGAPESTSGASAAMMAQAARDAGGGVGSATGAGTGAGVDGVAAATAAASPQGVATGAVAFADPSLWAAGHDAVLRCAFGPGDPRAQPSSAAALASAQASAAVPGAARGIGAASGGGGGGGGAKRGVRGAKGHPSSGGNGGGGGGGVVVDDESWPGHGLHARALVRRQFFILR